ncbi:uncharacterized protein [Diabrotica undecimpunctata]|uniref:uncharacterized protein n=1 Tax=Diabrotica undecimpunctata TaxID=50387 RepID=UPI003B631E59
MERLKQVEQTLQSLVGNIHLDIVDVQKMSKEKQQVVNELHKPTRKNYPRRRTIIKGIDDLCTYTIKKAAICERVIRTLKAKLYKYFSLHGSYKWLDALPIITEEYNNTKHSKTGYKPSQVNKSNEKAILNKSYSHLKIAGPRKFKVGDIVRVSKAKHFFEKAYTPNWTTELFKIVQVKITNPITYLLEDMQGTPISGGFYEEEMQKTSSPDIYLVEKVLRRKGNKMYVKWLGMDSKHNSWINANDTV